VTLAFAEHAHGLTRLSMAPAAVILASAPDELHDIPMTVLAAALAEHGVPALHLGARTPGRALRDAVTRVRPEVLALWAQDPGRAKVPPLPALRPSPALVLCGPGWPDGHGDQALARDLADAVNLVGSLLRMGAPALRGGPANSA
jgi:hypothetical protein